MATIGSDPNGRKRILFVGGDGRRRTIRLGIATVKQAESFKVKVEQLVSASITGVMDDEVSRWLASRDDQTHRRLCAVGLAKPRQQSRDSLTHLLDTFFNNLDVKPITRLGYGPTKESLLEFFGRDTLVRDIPPLKAEQWRTKMKSDGL